VHMQRISPLVSSRGALRACSTSKLWWGKRGRGAGSGARKGWRGIGVRQWSGWG
jgi:hypothetical protein